MSVVLLTLLGLLALHGRANGGYLVGAGRYDVTGPAAEIQFVSKHNAKKTFILLSEVHDSQCIRIQSEYVHSIASYSDIDIIF